MEKIIKQLRLLNLQDSEIKIYLFLLESSTLNAASIAKGTGIAHTNCYSVLESLLKKGLIEKLIQKNTSLYTANNPSILLNLVEKTKNTVIEELIPNLMHIHKSQINKPVVKFYEGPEQIKTVFLEMYEADESIIAFTSLNKLFPLFPGFFEKWRKELKKRNIFLKDILSADTKKEQINIGTQEMGVFFEHKIIPEKYGTIATDILIWNDKILLFTLEDPIFGTVITNGHLADTFRIIHRSLWDRLNT